MSGPAGPFILVGVDDGAIAKAALRWAADEAVLRNAPLTIVHAWQPIVPLEPAGMVTPPANFDLEASARRIATDLVGEVRSTQGQWPETWSVEIKEGPPGPVLVEMAHGAGLLVVGSHGHRALAEVFLGSVSRHVTHHAPCPVVVVRPTPR